MECPFECEYLQEARRHEKALERNAAEFPNRDIQVSEELVQANGALLAFLSLSIFHGAIETPGVVDSDVLEALDCLIRTYRTLQSGVYYESRPNNLLAASVYARVQDALTQYRASEQQELGMTKTRDADVLGLLVFLQYFALYNHNGRRRGRAFLGALRQLHPPAAEASGSSPSSAILR